MARVGVGLREDRVEARDAGVRDEALRAVQDVGVAVAPRGAAHRGGVRARARLGERVRGEELARREPRQVPLLLLVGAGELQPERPELLHGEDHPARRADLRDLLDHGQREQRAGAEAAVGLVEEEPEEPVLAVELDDVPRELVRLVDLGRPRRDAVARELPDQLADLSLLVGQRVERHARRLLRLVADRLDVVAVGVVDEGAVVVRVVVGAEPRRRRCPCRPRRSRLRRTRRRSRGRAPRTRSGRRHGPRCW